MITLSNGNLRVDVLPMGATLEGVYLKDDKRNLVLGFADQSDHQRVPVYAGAIVGPVANRLRGGHVRIGQTLYRMPRNENGHTTLHSGPNGLHAQPWEVLEQSGSAVMLQHILADGAYGLPGRRDITVHYQIEGQRLQLEITATTDQPSPINIAAHPYWNLDGRPDIAAHRLHVLADRFTPTDDANLPTGQINAVQGSIFDFSTPTPIPLVPEIDVNYCLSTASRARPMPAATLIGGDGTRLDLATTAPGVQVYNGAYLPNLPGALTQERNLMPYGGIALEPHYWPDAMHHAHFPNIILYPGMTHRQITTYALSTSKTKV